MGLLDDAASTISGRPTKHHHKKHKSRSRSRSRSRDRHGGGGFTASIFGGSEGHGHHGHHKEHREHRHGSSSFSIFGGDKHHEKHNASRGSFFGLGNASNASRGSFFGFSRPSYYKRSPRPNFFSRMLRHVRRLLRDLVYYAKRHPVKVLMLVVMPLVTGGALTALLARFGLRMPAGLERMLGIAARASEGGGMGLVGEAVRMAGSLGGGAGSVHLEKGREGGMEWERRSVERDMFGGGGRGYGSGGGGAGWGGLGNMVGVAKMFM